MDKVKDFWDNQATEFGEAAEATSPDSFYREYEIRRIVEWLPDKGGILDVGCGNGFSTLRFAKARPKAHFVGVDYSERMIELARMARDVPNVGFITGDVRQPITGLSPDVIISERCLINLESWEQQKEALRQLWFILPDGGRLILVENTVDGLGKLNEVRKDFGLSVIKQRWHNRYFNLDDLEFFLTADLKMAPIHRENIGSQYYLVSRCLYPALAALSGEEVRYDSDINRIAAKLPPVDGPYSPNMMWVLEK